MPEPRLRLRARVSLNPCEIDDEIAHRLVAVRRSFLQRLLDNEPQLDRDGSVHRLGRPVNDGLQNFEVGRAAKRPPCRKQFVEDDAERKDVTARVQCFAGRLLR